MGGSKGSRFTGAEGDETPVADLIPSHSVRLGKIQPQAPGYRTVFCNDPETTALANFKVSASLISLK